MRSPKEARPERPDLLPKWCWTKEEFVPAIRAVLGKFMELHAKAYKHVKNPWRIYSTLDSAGAVGKFAFFHAVRQEMRAVFSELEELGTLVYAESFGFPMLVIKDPTGRRKSLAIKPNAVDDGLRPAKGHSDLAKYIRSQAKNVYQNEFAFGRAWMNADELLDIQTFVIFGAQILPENEGFPISSFSCIVGEDEDVCWSVPSIDIEAMIAEDKKPRAAEEIPEKKRKRRRFRAADDRASATGGSHDGGAE